MLTYNQSQASFSPRQFSSMRMERYFFPKPIPRLAYGAFSCGLLLAIGSGALRIPLLFIAGVLLLSLSILWMIVVTQGNPTDQQYDQWVAAKANALLPDTLATFDLYEHQLTGQIKYIRSFVLPGSQIADNYRPDEVLIKRGRDGRWRCSINVCTYFIPTARYVAILTRDINVFSDSSSIWQNEEYPYQHIINATIPTFQDDAFIEDERYGYRMKRICLRIVNGEVIPLGACFSAKPIDDDWNAPDLSLPERDMYQTLNDLRRLLRTRNPGSRW